CLAQNNWNLVWSLHEKPFLAPQALSEMAIVKAGFDTDEDGWGEFLCAWTDHTPDNYILMYEATGDDTYELVWYWNYPISANSFAGIAVGDIDNNGTVEIITTMPSVANAETPNPPRLWVFEWNGVQGENKYGTYATSDPSPTNEWKFNLPDLTDFRPYSLVIEDIDQDGKNELIVGVRQGDRGREVLVASVEGQLSGFGQWIIEYNFQQDFGGSLYSVTTGDLDKDGNREIYALIWDMFTMRIFECMGDGQYEIVTEFDELYADEAIDYGALDGVRIADVNNDGVNELYIAGTQPQNTLFIINNISDVSQIKEDDIVEFYHIPQKADAGLRAMHIADPDKDGNLSLMIAGERNGQIFDLEYNGEGDPADSSSWSLDVIFDIFELSDTAASSLTPRLFYGHPAEDMDNDGKDEYVFVNYSSDFNVWEGDGYVWMVEIDPSTSVENSANLLPKKIELKQNYPNPFNPGTKINFNLDRGEHVKLVVTDILGREIETIVDNFLSRGTHSYYFNAKPYTSGVYYYTLYAGDFVQTRKMLFTK
ncbi:T9SS type A sorting domain-containing protein, partial [Bacteroidota bacterium]